MCRLCNIQVDPWKAARHKSKRTDFCREREGRERIVQTNAAIANHRALQVGFTTFRDRTLNGWMCLSIPVIHSKCSCQQGGRAIFSGVKRIGIWVWCNHLSSGLSTCQLFVASLSLQGGIHDHARCLL